MASKRAKNRRGCEGKVRHATADEAGRVAARYGGRARHIHAYRCPRCGFYHVGHVPRRVKLRRRREFVEWGS